MRSYKNTIILILLLLCTNSYAQVYPNNYFISPMDTPLLLSAPFGSLRENHFHSGMDIRTYEREGLPVYAVADGYVSRIKVSPFGYGKAVYVDHPNGYTSVYGHLLKYEGELADYIKQFQYKNETFDFDHFPAKGAIRVIKGQIIGYSGNSGGSTGPHLHFEIRNTRSEEPINPELFGVYGVDSLKPFIKRLAFYNTENFNARKVADVIIDQKKIIRTDSGDLYKDTLIILHHINGVGIEAYDYLTNKSKEYSIYCSDLYVDGKRQFSYRISKVNFDDSRDINAHIDYETYKRDGHRIQKCFLDDGNKAQVYPFMRNKGYINITDTSIHQLQFCVGDVHGNSYTFYTHIKVKPIVKPIINTCTDVTFYPNRDNVISNSLVEIKVPSGCLYDTLRVCYMIMPDKYKNILSPVVQVHHPYTPLRKNISVSIKSDSLNQNKLLLALVNKDGSLRAAGGEYKNGKVSSSISQFGNYAIAIDSIKPDIRLLNANKDGLVKDTFSLNVKITDNFSGINTYKMMLNGKWILGDYDAKNDLLVYLFDKQTLFNTKQELTVVVTDKKGNTSTLKKEITFIK